MNNLAIEARKLQDHGCRIEDPENVGRLATEHVNEDEWDHVSRHMQLRETLKTGPLSLREALNKHVHGKVRSYRIDQGHHVLLSYGQLGNKPWIAEWTVEAFCDELKKLIVKAAQSNVSCVAGNV